MQSENLHQWETKTIFVPMWHKVEVDMSAWYGEKSDFPEKKTGRALSRQIILQTYFFSE